MTTRFLSSFHGVLRRGGALCAAVVVLAAPSVLQARPEPIPDQIPTNVKEFDVEGIRVILRPSGPANHVIYSKLFIRGGVTALPEQLSPAVASLALDIPIASGPQGTDRAAYQRELQRLVIGISSATDRDYAVVNMRCVDEVFDRAWELYTGVILRPQYDAVELRNAKEREITALRNRDINPESYAVYLADSVYFHGHPYGRFAQESDIPLITASMLQKEHDAMMVKSRLFLVVVGNVDSAVIHQKVASTFGKLPMGSYRERPLPTPPNSVRPQLVVRRPYGNAPAVTNYLVARFPAPGPNDSLYYPMMRLISFVSGSLFREIRVDRNLSYAPDADVKFNKASYGDITVSTTLPDSAWRVAKREVIDFFRDYIIDGSNITSGLSSWITSHYVREQTNESQAQRIGEAYLLTGSWKNGFGTVDGISSITPEQMNEAAQRYLKNFTVVIVGDPDAVTPAEYVARSSH